MPAFTHVDRVRFADLDAMGHLNNVALLTFFESARIAYVANRVQDRGPHERDEFGLIFAECHVSYRSPAYFDEELRTTIVPSDLARSSLRLNFTMRAAGEDRLVAEGYGVLVGFDFAARRAQPLPEAFTAAVAPDLAA